MPVSRDKIEGLHYLLVVSFGKPHMVLKLRKSIINALNESQFKIKINFEL